MSNLRVHAALPNCDVRAARQTIQLAGGIVKWAATDTMAFQVRDTEVVITDQTVAVHAETEDAARNTVARMGFDPDTAIITSLAATP